MSKFNGSSSFFKRNTYQFDIKPTSSQKQQKKNKKQNNPISDIVSDNEFDKLMEENNNVGLKKVFKLSDYFSGVKNSEIASRLVQEQIVGNDLLIRIESENVTGSQLLKEILNKFEPDNIEWINKNQYGSALKLLLEENSKEQLVCLFLIQNYSYTHGFPKINYKDKEVYYIKMIFHLLFTNDIIDESTYLEWLDILTDLVDIDNSVKNIICIQTAEFINIFKMTFTDQDYENDQENYSDVNKDKTQSQSNTSAKLNSKLSNKSDKVSDDESDNDESDKCNVPEEQDYNMDDGNEDYNLDDL